MACSAASHWSGVADVLLGVGRVAEGDLGRKVLEPERPEHQEREADDVLELAFDLVGPAEDVGVVDGKAADAREPAELARLLKAVDLPELRQAHREVAVRARRVGVDLRVVRAVHRLEEVPVALVLGRLAVAAGAFRQPGGRALRPRVRLAPLDLRRRRRSQHRGELALGVVRVVPARPVQVQPADVRGDDGEVPTPDLLGLEKVDERLAQLGPLGQPHWEARPHALREEKEAEVAPQLPVVPLLRELQPLQVLLQKLLLREADAVDPCELRAALVAPPVGPGQAQELDGLDRLRRRQVRAPAEVGKVAPCW